MYMQKMFFAITYYNFSETASKSYYYYELAPLVSGNFTFRSFCTPFTCVHNQHVTLKIYISTWFSSSNIIHAEYLSIYAGFWIISYRFIVKGSVNMCDGSDVKSFILFHTQKYI